MEAGASLFDAYGLRALQAAAAASGTQGSGAEGAGKSARYGNPKHGATIACKRALSLGDPRVLGTLASLGSVQDTRLSELLSAHLFGTLRTLVVDTRACRCACYWQRMSAWCCENTIA
jgi:hypothetical protein